MNFSIRNNIAVTNALHNNETNSKIQAKTAGGLSSGEKFTSAGDAPASYQISEKMRVQLRALDQCEDNSEKGKDLLGVALGAIDQQKEIMKTVRAKILEAANGTCSKEDLTYIQEEIDQLFSEYDNIAATTNFQGRYLLNQYSSEMPQPSIRDFLPAAHLFDVNSDPAVDFFPSVADNDKWQEMTGAEFDSSDVGVSIGGVYL